VSNENAGGYINLTLLDSCLRAAKIMINAFQVFCLYAHLKVVGLGGLSTAKRIKGASPAALYGLS